MSNGILIISLDFELIWGMSDKIDVESNLYYFENAIESIPLMLNIFEKNKIEVTWGIVGMLLNKNIEQWKSNIPIKKPNYRNSILSNYSFFSKKKRYNKKYCFNSELIQLIKKTKYQNIGSHTYSHYYCLEKGQDIYSFESDIKTFNKISQEFGFLAESVIFPRNQFNKSYNTVLKEYGIKIIRTNPDVWFWRNHKRFEFLKKVMILLDAYIPLSSTTFKQSQIKIDEVVQLPASRFMRPNTNFYLIDLLKVSRIKKEMLEAAKKREIYHLWWHPHNFGNNLNKSLTYLMEIISYFCELRDEFGMQSKSMESFYHENFEKKAEG